MPGFSTMEVAVAGNFPVPTAVVDGKLSTEQRSYWENELRQYAPGDVKMFFWSVEKYRLNPFGVAQIYPLPIDGKLVTHVGINGLVLIAQRTGLYGGMTEPVWCAQPKDTETMPVWRDMWNYVDARGNPVPPAAAKVGASVRGHNGISYFVANWSESFRKAKDGRPAAQWAKQPALMLAKVAAAGALRRTFQQEFAELSLTFAGSGDAARVAPSITDLYPDTPDTTRRPKLVSGITAEPEPEEGSYREAPAPPKQPQPQATNGAQRQGKDPDGATEFWTVVRASGLKLPHDTTDCLGFPTPLTWLKQDGARTWAGAIAAFNAKHKPWTEPTTSGSSPSSEEPKQEPVAELDPHEARAYALGKELGYMNDAATRAWLVNAFDGTPIEELIEGYGWEMLADCLAKELHTESQADAAPDAAAADEGVEQPALMAVGSGDPVNSRRK